MEQIPTFQEIAPRIAPDCFFGEWYTTDVIKTSEVHYIKNGTTFTQHRVIYGAIYLPKIIDIIVNFGRLGSEITMSVVINGIETLLYAIINICQSLETPVKKLEPIPTCQESAPRISPDQTCDTRTMTIGFLYTLMYIMSSFRHLTLPRGSLWSKFLHSMTRCKKSRVFK